MNNSIDRQGILDNLTAIETTAKLLVNAFVKKNTDTELSLNGIHREELINQTTTFLSQAQKLILNLSNTFNLSTDEYFSKSSKENPNDDINSTSLIIDASNNKTNLDDNHSQITYSISTVTLDDIIQNRLTPNDLLPNYPLLHDSNPPSLFSIARSLRSIENVDNLMLKAHSKIFNHEERMCCNYDGTHGKLPYPRHKRLVIDLLLKLILNERNQTLNNDEQRQLYAKCEKHFSIDTALSKYRGMSIDQINKNNRINDEKQFICSLFRLILPKEDVQHILAAKQDLSSEWNDNDLCIYYTRPTHLLWIKQKWLERYPLNNKNEPEKWSQCIDWAIDSFVEKKEVRPSKRKTKDMTVEQKRTKDSSTFEDKCKTIDRTKYNILEYANQILQFISEDNHKNLPSLKQLQIVEHEIFHFYWTSNIEQTWSNILDTISHVFLNEFNDDFRQSYFKRLLETDENDREEIERLLQIKI